MLTLQHSKLFFFTFSPINFGKAGCHHLGVATNRHRCCRPDYINFIFNGLNNIFLHQPSTFIIYSSIKALILLLSQEHSLFIYYSLFITQRAIFKKVRNIQKEFKQTCAKTLLNLRINKW
jgi:hypothetical protein